MFILRWIFWINTYFAVVALEMNRPLDVDTAEVHICKNWKKSLRLVECDGLIDWLKEEEKQRKNLITLAVVVALGNLS